MRPSYASDRAWSLALLQKLTKGETVPKIITVLTKPLFGGKSCNEYTYPKLNDSDEVLAESSSSRATLTEQASNGNASDSRGACSDALEDREELQKILSAAAASADGAFIDLSSPRRVQRKSCAETLEDRIEMQKILWSAAKSLNGATLDISDTEEADATVPSPDRKKSKHDDDLVEVAPLGGVAEEDENVFGFSLDLDSGM